MNGQQLIDFIKQNNLENAQIFVGCQGYTNMDDPKEEYMINCNIFISNNNHEVLLIADSCYYNEEIKEYKIKL